MTTMSAGTFLRVAPLLPASTSIMLRGNHGIGKSQLGRQLATLIAEKESIENYEVIDRRLSQMSEGDVIGLPSTDGETTRFNPPDWYRKACISPCFLFLDELNRATPEVMQAAFQIVLDRELNGWKLHPKTRVMTAVNSASSYNVNEIDPALLDRFWCIDLDPSTEDFLTWGKKENSRKAHGFNCLPLVTDFILANQQFLDPPKNVEPGAIHVSRRSWERCGDALHEAGVANTPENEIFYAICTGYLGTEASIKFTEFAKESGANFTGLDILENYTSKFRKRLTAPNRRSDTLNEVIEKIGDAVKPMNVLSEKHGKNLGAFCADLPGELRIVLWTKLTQNPPGGGSRLEFTKSAQNYCAKYILEFFNVTMASKDNKPEENKSNAAQTQSTGASKKKK